MMSLRRNTDFTANSARITSVPALNFGSLIVVQASTPSTAKQISAMVKRLIKSWCTGKDSNLRTSLGGTDLQSVGFNHSPTCAKTLGRCGRCAPSADHRMQGPLESTHAKPADQTQQSHKP